MKIFFTGNGMVGKELRKNGCIFLDCDILDRGAIADKLSRANKHEDVLIHTAALTDIDTCEEYPERALKINARGTMYILDVWKGKFIYISTDHVFPGKWNTNGYREFHTEKPINNYGNTKLAGEKIALSYENSKIIRTSKLFDKEFVERRLSPLPKDVTTLIWRSFMHVEHFVDGLRFVADNWEKVPNILNISSTEIMNYHRFLCLCAEHYGYDTNMLVPRKNKLKNVSPRPFRAGLDVFTAKQLGMKMYSTREGIQLL